MCQYKIYAQMLTAALFIIAKSWKQFKCMMDTWTIVAHSYSGKLLGNKKGQSSNIYKSIRLGERRQAQKKNKAKLIHSERNKSSSCLVGWRELGKNVGEIGITSILLWWGITFIKLEELYINYTSLKVINKHAHTPTHAEGEEKSVRLCLTFIETGL